MRSGYALVLGHILTVRCMVNIGVFVTVLPSMIIKAGLAGVQGRYTDYAYCTGDTGEKAGSCISTVQMTGSGVCVDYDVGEPEDGQKPSGSMSGVAQSVQWVVGEDGTYPGIYGNATHYPITVNWSVELATSTSRLWPGPFSARGLSLM